MAMRRSVFFEPDHSVYLAKNCGSGRREQLTPDYPIGGKRHPHRDDFYRRSAASNVEIVTGSIDHCERLRDRDGTAGAAPDSHAHSRDRLSGPNPSTCPDGDRGDGGRASRSDWSARARRTSASL